jgi:hypothetical protein
MVSVSEVATGAIAPSIAPDYLQALHHPDHRHLCRLASFVELYISAVGLINYFTLASDWLGPPRCWPLYRFATAAALNLQHHAYLELIPMVNINTIVNVRGMSQHPLLEHENASIRGSSTLLCNPVPRFFMCNENSTFDRSAPNP